MKLEENIFFSIVIPTYNQSNFIKDSVNSVLSQTYKNFEILVMDDGSTDNTVKIVKEINDSRIIYEWNNNSGGPAKPRNLGISRAKGKWICFLDADDIWYKNKLMNFYNEINLDKKDSFEVICSNELLVNSETKEKKIIKHGPFSENFYKDLLIKGNRLSPSATSIKIDFLKKNRIVFRENADFFSVEDYDFWMMLAKENAKFKFLNTIDSIYTIHSKNISVNSLKHINNTYKLIYDHVYNIQKFEKDKKKLWKKIKIRLSILKMKFLVFKKKSYFLGFFIIFKSFLESPLQFCKIIFGKIK